MSWPYHARRRTVSYIKVFFFFFHSKNDAISFVRCCLSGIVCVFHHFLLFKLRFLLQFFYLFYSSSFTEVRRESDTILFHRKIKWFHRNRLMILDTNVCNGRTLFAWSIEFAARWSFIISKDSLQATNKRTEKFHRLAAIVCRYVFSFQDIFISHTHTTSYHFA